ncbi:hypothetical protein GF348_16755 [candidate division KSB3 bacterium]|nr:hypothetical protein [candidate division KSB3 bacterium]
MPTFLPEPARFTKQHYKKFLKTYPHVEAILNATFVHEGQQYPLVEIEGQEVRIHVLMLSEEQQKALGIAAIRELRKHISRSQGSKIWMIAAGVVILVVAAIGIYQLTSGPENGGGHGEETPTPAPTPMSTATSTPRPSPVPPPTPAATPTPTLVPTATPTPTTPPTAPPTPAPTAVPSIARVILRDQEGFIIHEDGNRTYWVKPGERITIQIDIAGPSADRVKIEYRAIRGDVQLADNNSAVYTASDKPESKDVVTLKILDTMTNKILDQYACKMQTLDMHPKRVLPTPTSGVIASQMQIEGPVHGRAIIYKPDPPQLSDIEDEVELQLKFWVLPDGTIGEVIPLKRGSTHLERIAVAYLREWRFEALPPDVPQENIWGTIPIVFRSQW